MDELQQQILIDFHSYLAGNQAPALVGPSLVRVMRSEVQAIARMVMGWAMRLKTGFFEEHVVQARRKVFDIFFYRIVQPGKIFDFFPKFESLILALCPAGHLESLRDYFAKHPWQSIRPLGDLDRMPLYAFSARSRPEVKADTFNEGVYKNVTHNILSVKNRFVFQDEKTSTMMAEHSAKVNALFQCFVDQVRDRQAREEISIANEADQDAVYETPTQFSFEDYLLQSVDLAVAFFNDDYLFHSVRMMDLLVELAKKNEYGLDRNAQFQNRHSLFSAAKIEEYTTGKTNRFLIRRIIGLFAEWQPTKLLARLREEENRRTRRTLSNVLECYGSDLYPLLLKELEGCRGDTPWQHVHGIVSLLGRVSPPDPELRRKAIDLVAPHLHPASVHQLNMQAIATLVGLGTEAAVNILGQKLALFKRNTGSAVMEVSNRIALSLLVMGMGKPVESALNHLFSEWSDEVAEQIAQGPLSNPAMEHAVRIIRKEVKKLKISFNILGDDEKAGSLLKALSTSRSADVLMLCQEIKNTLSARHKLSRLADEILAQAAEPSAFSVEDVHLSAPAMEKNIPEMVHYIHEAGLDGTLTVRDTHAATAVLEFDAGALRRAEISPLEMGKENIFFWTCLLDQRDIAQLNFVRREGGMAGLGLAPEEGSPTSLLLREALLQRGEVRQMSGAIMLPESRFCRRPVAEFQLRFRGAENPENCRLVWDALAQRPDIPALEATTRLSKYELYKILFFLIRRGLAAIHSDALPSDIPVVEEGLAMLDLYLERISARPILFNLYKSAAQMCENLSQATTDGAIRGSLQVLGRYFSDSWAQHRVFGESHLDVCAQVAGLVGNYLANRTEPNRQALLDYVRFAFEEQITAEAAPAPPEPPKTVLQKIENIELGNDAFDAGINRLFDDEAVGDFLGELDRAFGGDAGDRDIGLGAKSASMTAAEEEMLMELYDNIAAAYVKPLKDFVREIRMNTRIHKPVSTDWLGMVEPALRLLHGSAEKMSASRICLELGALKATLDRPMGSDIPEPVLVNVLKNYERLSTLLPRTFSLNPSDTDLSSKKEVLITRFILRQVPDLKEKQVNRIILAGLSTFDKYMQSSPEEISAVTGLPKELSEEIFMKFYQYRHVYYRPDDDEYRDKFFRMYEVKLNALRETHAEIEKLALTPDSTEVRTRMQTLQSERQTTFWGLVILLCIKEEYDLIETLQQAVYHVRLKKLEAYFLRLGAEPLAVGAAN